MAVCLPCVTEHGGKIKESTKFHRIIGWDGVCSICNKVTLVFSNQDMGMNPTIRKDKLKR